MKIALSFPGCHRGGGVERIMFECANFLAGNGHDVHVYANRWEDDPTGRIRFHRVGMPPQPPFIRVAWHYRASTRHLRNTSYQVLGTHGCICPTGGVHWVQSVHRAWLERARAFRPRFSWVRLRQQLNPLHPVLLRLETRHFRDRRYRKLIATTTEVRDDLARYYGVPATDVVVIPNGFSPTEFDPRRRAALRDQMRRQLDLAPDDLALLLVANELERKGYPTLLKALRLLQRRDLRLLVVGRHSVRQARSLAAEMGLAEQVVVCGPSSDVAAYHAAADLFVLPTQYEAFCLAIVEALGSGLPVVTSRVPGACDAIQEGVNGLLIQDPDNAEELAAVLEQALDRDQLKRLSSQAPATAQPYQWPNILRKYEEVLTQCAW